MKPDQSRRRFRDTRRKTERGNVREALREVVQDCFDRHDLHGMAAKEFRAHFSGINSMADLVAELNSKEADRLAIQLKKKYA